MNKLKVILASALIVFSIIDVEAQRRRNNNNNRDNVRTRTTRIIRTRPNVRFGYNNRNIYFNRYHSYYNPGFYNRTYLGHRFVTVRPPGFYNEGLTSVIGRSERLEEIRAYMLYKYNLKKSKRNARRLMKYNILTEREANEDIN